MTIITAHGNVLIINRYNPAIQHPASAYPGIACIDCGFRGGPHI